MGATVGDRALGAALTHADLAALGEGQGDGALALGEELGGEAAPARGGEGLRSLRREARPEE
ncbi:MAG: hypothetical protein ABI193_05210, partial [Minicystis sp.]